MMNFYEINKAYKETGLYNHTLESLSNENKGIQKLAMEKVSAMNFQSAADVKLYVAMNI